MNVRITAPIPFFHDAYGEALEDGAIYIGESGQNPKAYAKAAYWDEALTALAPQPVPTMAGRPSRNGAPSAIFVDGQYSILVQDRAGETVYSALTEGGGASVAFANVAAFLASTSTYSAGQVIATSSEGYIYDAVDSGGNVTNAGGQEFVARPLQGAYVPEQFGAKHDGTDDQSSLEVWRDACEGGGVTASALTGDNPYGQTDVLKWSAGVDFKFPGAINCEFRALQGFPTQFSDVDGDGTAITLPAPQFFVDRRAETGDPGLMTIEGVTIGGGSPGGTRYAPIGLIVTQGGKTNIRDVVCQDHTSYNLVIDACQQLQTIGVRTRRCDGPNYYVINFTRQTRFEDVDARKGGQYAVHMRPDSGFPGWNSVVSGNNTPKDICVGKGVLEEVIDGATRANVVYLEECDNVTIDGTQIVDSEGARTGAIVKIGASANFAKIIDAQLNGGGAAKGALEIDGAGTEVIKPNFIAIGATSTPAPYLLTTSATCRVEIPRTENCVVSGDQFISSESGAAKELNLAVAHFLRSQGRRASRPTSANSPGTDPTLTDGVTPFYETDYSRATHYNPFDGENPGWLMTDGTPTEANNTSLGSIANGGTANVVSVATNQAWRVAVFKNSDANGAYASADCILFTNTSDPAETELFKVNSASAGSCTLTLSGGSIVFTNGSGSTATFRAYVRRIG